MIHCLFGFCSIYPFWLQFCTVNTWFCILTIFKIYMKSLLLQTKVFTHPKNGFIQINIQNTLTQNSQRTCRVIMTPVNPPRMCLS